MSIWNDMGMVYALLGAAVAVFLAGAGSAIGVGIAGQAASGVVAKKPDQFGKAMLFPAMVETYAILALLISILSVTAIQV